MATTFDEDFRTLFNDSRTAKVLATTGENHAPYVVVEPPLHIDDAGQIVYLESYEQSPANRNLVRAIWFGGRVAVQATTPERKRYHLTGRPLRALVAGPIFQAHYEQLRARRGDVDLSTVWIITPDGIEEQSSPVREASSTGGFPLLHLDRIARPSNLESD